MSYGDAGIPMVGNPTGWQFNCPECGKPVLLTGENHRLHLRGKSLTIGTAIRCPNLFENKQPCRWAVFIRESCARDVS